MKGKSLVVNTTTATKNHASSTPPLVEQALDLARRGLHVFPVHGIVDGHCTCKRAATCEEDAGKHPIYDEDACRNGFKDATLDKQIIRTLFLRHPNANIGIRTGAPSRIVVVDIDTDREGGDTLFDLEKTYGPLPKTWEVVTGSGGRHLYFRHPGTTIRCSTNGLGPGIDVRGDGGYVVAPRSRHKCGGRYEWEASSHPDDVDLADLPAWLLDRLVNGNTAGSRRNRARGAAPGEQPPSEDEGPIVEGTRNPTLFSRACFYRHYGAPEDEILAVLRAMNQRCVARDGSPAPLSDKVLLKIARSAMRYRPTVTESPERAAGRAMPRLSAPDLADAIRSQNHFARDGGGALYQYVNGVYRPADSLVLDGAVLDHLSRRRQRERWSTRLVAEVTKLLTIETPALWEVPPLGRINVRNGLIDLATGELRPHTPEHLSTIQLPVVFDPDAQCPAWDRFVAEVFPEDTRALAYEIVAYLMRPDTSRHKAILLVGEGRNGKSTFLKGLTAFLGPENVSNVSLRDCAGHRFMPAELVGKLANVPFDTSSALLEDTALLKSIIAGDPIMVERKHERPFSVRPFARLIVATNRNPQTNDDSRAFPDRWVVVPFLRRFVNGEKRNQDALVAELSDPRELSGFLNRALRARRDRFTTSATTAEAHQAFSEETDPFRRWLTAHTASGPDRWVTKDELRERYAAACRAERRATIPPNKFTEALTERRPEVCVKRKLIDGVQVPIFLGIALKGVPDGGAAG